MSYSSSEEYAFLAPFYSRGNVSPVVKPLAFDSVGTARVLLDPHCLKLLAMLTEALRVLWSEFIVTPKTQKAKGFHSSCRDPEEE